MMPICGTSFLMARTARHISSRCSAPPSPWGRAAPSRRRGRGDGRDAECGRVRRLADGLVDIHRPRPASRRRAYAAARNPSEDRPDQVVGGEARLAHHRRDQSALRLRRMRRVSPSDADMSSWRAGEGKGRTTRDSMMIAFVLFVLRGFRHAGEVGAPSYHIGTIPKHVSWSQPRRATASSSMRACSRDIRGLPSRTAGPSRRSERMTQEHEIICEIRGAAGVVVLDRPKALNALSLGMVRELARALDAWERDPQVTARRPQHESQGLLRRWRHPLAARSRQGRAHDDMLAFWGRIPSSTTASRPTQSPMSR